MPKSRELSFEQRAVRYMRESGLSYHEIGKQVGLHLSTAIKSCKQFALTGSVANKERTGCPIYLATGKREYFVELLGD